MPFQTDRSRYSLGVNGYKYRPSWKIELSQVYISLPSPILRSGCGRLVVVVIGCRCRCCFFRRFLVVWFSRSLGFRCCCCFGYGFCFLSSSPSSSWISLDFGFLVSAAVFPAVYVFAFRFAVCFRLGYQCRCLRAEPFGFVVLISLFFDLCYLESRFLLEFVFLHN